MDARERTRARRGRLEHDERAARAEDARDLRQGLAARPEVAHAERDRDGVDEPGAQRQPEPVRAHEARRPSRATLLVGRVTQHAQADVDADHEAAGLS